MRMRGRIVQASRIVYTQALLKRQTYNGFPRNACQQSSAALMNATLSDKVKMQDTRLL